MVEKQLASDCAKAVVESNETIKDALEEIRKNGGFGKQAAEEGSKKANAWDVAFEIYVNSLLSSPTTHTVNAVSNMVPITTRVLETLSSATVSKAFRHNSDKIAYREAVAEMHGLMEGFKDAINFMNLRIRSLGKGMTNEDLLKLQHLPDKLAIQSKIERQHQVITGKNFESAAMKHTLNWIGNTINIPGSALSTSDTFFKIINYRAEIAKQAFRKAFNQSDVPVNQAYRQFKQAALDGTDTDLVAKGIADADIRTYTNEPSLAINKWMATKGHAHRGVRWFVPFRRAVVNIIEYGITRSPAGVIASIFPNSVTGRALRSANQAERAEAIGRIAMGSMLVSAVSAYFGDKLTGGAPHEPRLRELWENNNNAEFSIKIGEANFPMQNLGPFGTILKAVAAYKQLAVNMDIQVDGPEGEGAMYEMAEALTIAIADVLADEHWVGNIITGFEALGRSFQEKSLKPLAMYGARFATGFAVPNIIRSKKMGANLLLDPYKKEVSGPLDYFLSNVPYWSKKINPRIDMWGNPMLYDDYLADEYKSRITGKDPVAAELLRLEPVLGLDKKSKSYPVGRHMSVEMTPDEYTAMMIYAGKGVPGMPSLRQELANRMQHPIYQQFTTDQGRADYLKDAILGYQQAAQQYLMIDPRFDFGKRVQEARMKDAQIRGVQR